MIPERTVMDNDEKNLTEGMQESAAVDAAAPARKRKRDSSYFKWGLTILVVVTVLIFLYFGLFKTNSFFNFVQTVWNNLKPFAVGAVIAYLLRPLCHLFEKITTKWFAKMKNRKAADKWVLNLSIAFSMIVFVLFIGLVIYSVIPQVVESIKTFISEFPSAYEKSIEWIKNLDIVKSNTRILEHIDEVSGNLSDTVTTYLVNTFGKDGSKLATTLTSGIKSAYSVIKNLFFGFVSSIYLLNQRHKMKRQGKMLIYSIFKQKAADAVVDEIKFCDRMFNGFLTGKIIDSVIIGVLCFIVCSIFRIPYALLVSVFVGITNIIPFFGPFIGAIPTAFIILMVSPIKCLYFVIIIIILQQFDGNVLGPKILGETTGVQSFWVLFSVLFFGGLWGFTGMLIGVPLFAVIYDIITRLVKKGLNKHGQKELLSEYNKEKVEEAHIEAEKEDRKRHRIKRMMEKRAARKQQRENKKGKNK